jgi:hypothetical protein
MRIAQLDEKRLSRLRALEDELGICLIALEREFRLADLSEPQLKKVQAAEKDLGVVLLAYECR